MVRIFIVLASILIGSKVLAAQQVLTCGSVVGIEHLATVCGLDKKGDPRLCSLVLDNQSVIDPFMEIWLSVGGEPSHFTLFPPKVGGFSGFKTVDPDSDTLVSFEAKENHFSFQTPLLLDIATGQQYAIQGLLGGPWRTQFNEIFFLGDFFEITDQRGGRKFKVTCLYQ